MLCLSDTNSNVNSIAITIDISITHKNIYCKPELYHNMVSNKNKITVLHNKYDTSTDRELDTDQFPFTTTHMVFNYNTNAASVELAIDYFNAVAHSVVHS